MHCASLGEFEQGRPVAEALKATFPACKIVISFFSPSGYEVARKSPVADFYTYLPFDSAGNAEKFIATLKPKVVIFVKYEFWHFYLKTLRQHNIPTLLISALFRPNQPFFKPWGSFYRNMLRCFTHIFVQNSASEALLKKVIPGHQCSISGDTRFDRVCNIAEHWQEVPFISAFCENAPALIAGSTWHEDEVLLEEWLQQAPKAWKLIIAPHEVNSGHLQQLAKLFPSAIFYSTLSPGQDLRKNRVLIIDCIGLLSRLYKYATLAYVGGGFTKDGIHNILEAAVYGKPVFSGPQYNKYLEAIELKAEGAYFPVHNAAALSSTLAQINIAAAGKAAAEYVKNKSGATAKILAWIQEKRLLTNA